MLFKKHTVTAAVSLALAGCGGGSGDSGDNKTTIASGTGTKAVKEFVLSGNIFEGIGNTYSVKICAGKVCDSQLSDSESGGYEFKLRTDQWPDDLPLKLTASYAPQGMPQGILIEQELASLSELAREDLNEDGLITSDEYGLLIVNPISSTMDTVLSELETRIPSALNVTPANAKRNDLLVMISEATRFVDLNQDQLSTVRARVKEHNTDLGKSWSDPKAYPASIPIVLTIAQLQEIGISANESTPEVDRTIQLGIYQMFQVAEKHEYDQVVTISVPRADLAKLKGELIYDQNLVFELAAVASELFPKQPEKDTEGNDVLGNQPIPAPDQPLADIVSDLIQVLQKEPDLALFDAYKAMLQPHSIALTSQEEADIQARFEKAIKELADTNYESILMSAFLDMKPKRSLVIEGRYPSLFKEAKLAIKLGTKAKPEPDSYYYTQYGKYHPPRIIDTPLMDSHGNRRTQISQVNQSRFSVTVTLPDDADTFNACKPGAGQRGTYTWDNMQDNLTVVIYDPISGAEVRSLLGSFCELVTLDANSDGVLTETEYDRLNVGYVATAQTVLLQKATLNSYGGTYDYVPKTLEEIKTGVAALPRDMVEVFAGLAAVQAEGVLFGYSIDLMDEADFHRSLLTLLNINLAAEYGMWSDNNILPDYTKLYERLGDNEGLGEVLLAHPDKNVSHITQAATQLLLHSELDKSFYTENQVPGADVLVYENSPISPVCLDTVAVDQVVRVGLKGKGLDAQNKPWVTVNWKEVEASSHYTVVWSKTPFTDEAQAEFRAENIQSDSLTLNGLEMWQKYYIQIIPNSGTPSALLEYMPGQKFVADTHILMGPEGSDANHGRDSNSHCNPLAGKAFNSDQDGLASSRYLKLDEQGQSLARQDLSFKQSKFSCVVDQDTGLVWETKAQIKDTDAFTLNDDRSLFAYKTFPTEDRVPFNGSCYNPETGALETGTAICNVQNQIKWMNEAKHCGLSNWRLPETDETYALMDYKGQNRANWDSRYFPFYSGFGSSTIEWSNSVGQKNYTQIYHAFWLNDQEIEADKAHTLRPDLHLSGSAHDMWEPHYIMLVSDGFNTNTSAQ
ncbi:DUF1566 domain-containing protein [Vibrio sp. S9_S30]|uniref:Lcl domain-containing protein n=1 Tax=Vibrio sp. S9_S30 TaxID=2720226 RepID=UPI0016800546|nr:DUF1566 domain-containing protein [Vibrio sp. S9_S30]MBD1556176.1 DUF1566 domain-containing protein [Vibrio sp. S9_S30]